MRTFCRVVWCVGVASAISAFAYPSNAQIINGRVTDSSGAPIPSVRILARPAGDASDLSLRTAVTNERGEFRLIAAKRGSMTLSALRIGFRPTATQTIEIGADDARIEIVMANLPMTLATIQVTPRQKQCVPLDSPDQSPEVRDWVRQAQNLIRVRRAVERDYAYRVEETRSHWIGGGAEPPKITTTRYVQMPGATGRIEMEEKSAARPAARMGNNSVVWRPVQEGTMLSDAFTSRTCYENVFTTGPDNTIEIAFRESNNAVGALSLVGTFRMTERGVMTQIDFRLLRGGRRYGEGTSTYTTVEIAGEAFPMITQHDQRMSYLVGSADSPVAELWDAGRLLFKYQYSAFTRLR